MIATPLRMAVLAAGLAGFAAMAAAQEGGAVVVPMNDRAAPATDRALTLADAAPDENGIRRAAVFRGLDKVTARVSDFLAPVGVPVRFGALEVTARTCNKRPPEETPEVSVFVEIDDISYSGEARRLFSGWMFASSPALNPVEHAVYDVWVIDCRTDAPEESAGRE
jgi:hypothetical protein